jgi:hypothetical protein
MKKNVHEQVLRNGAQDWLGRLGKANLGKQVFGFFLCIFVATLCGIPCNDMSFYEEHYTVNKMKSVFSTHSPSQIHPTPAPSAVIYLQDCATNYKFTPIGYSAQASHMHANAYPRQDCTSSSFTSVTYCKFGYTKNENNMRSCTWTRLTNLAPVSKLYNT